MNTVDEVMSTEVTTVTTSEIVGTVRDLMLDRHIGMVPVLDDSGRPVGIITVSDLVEEWAPQLGVVEAMSPVIHSVAPTTSLEEAAQLMRDHEVHHLVVTQDEKMVGVVSTFDLIGALAVKVREAATRPVGATHAQVGDHIVIRGHTVGARERRGIITDTRGDDGGPPYMVQWLDEPREHPHEVLFFPGSDADVEPPGDET